MEYKSEFAQRLIESAEVLFKESFDSDEAGRAILYLSCLSCEISLKSLLESIGYSPKELKKYSHRLDYLLNEVSSCSFNDTGYKASSIRGKVVVPKTANGTVGTLLTAEISGASVYPNGIRYGDIVQHYPPEAMMNCAKIVSEWCNKNRYNIVR